MKKIILGISITSIMFISACQTDGANQKAVGEPTKVELTKPNEAVQSFIDANKLVAVDYAYVLDKVGNGTRIGAKATIFDVRTEKLYQAGHIPSSYFFSDAEFDKYYPKYQHLDKTKEIIAYCGGYDCIKSPKLAKMLIDKGFTNVKIYLAGMPEWETKNYSEIETITAKSAFDKNSAVFIDSRPYKVYMSSTIPGSIYIPDTEIEEFIGRAPRDINTPVVIFCGGYECAKSHTVARRLITLGYKNVKVFGGGMPEWESAKYATTGKGAVKVADAKPALPEFITVDDIQLVGNQEDNEGAVYGKWYLEMIKNKPANFELIDVRTKAEYAAGHIKGAINVSKDELSKDEFVAKLPKNKTIIFNCSVGGRSMEARQLAKDKGLNPKKIFYIDAKVKCDKENNCDIKVNDPL